MSDQVHDQNPRTQKSPRCAGLNMFENMLGEC